MDELGRCSIIDDDVVALSLPAVEAQLELAATLPRVTASLTQTFAAERAMDCHGRAAESAESAE
jgi:hypothetical protein